MLRKVLTLALALCAAAAASAQDRELRLSYLEQKAPASGSFPEGSYRHTALTLILDLSRWQGGPRALLSFGGATAASGESSYGSASEAGKFHPGAYAVVGLALASPGPFRVAAGLEARFTTIHLSTAQATSTSAPVLGKDQKPKTRLWGVLDLSWSPARPRAVNPVFGLRAGVASEDGPNPNRELGLFAGLRF